MKLNWGQSLVIFFIVFLSLAIFFIVFSLRQNNDLVTEDYYEKGADYTTQININNRSLLFTDSIRIVQDEADVRIRFHKGLFENVNEFDVYFFRPSNKKNDYRVKAPSDSILIFDKTKLFPGRYKVHISWELNGEHYLVTKDIMVN